MSLYLLVSTSANLILASKLAIQTSNVCPRGPSVLPYAASLWPTPEPYPPPIPGNICPTREASISHARSLHSIQCPGLTFVFCVPSPQHLPLQS